MVEVSKMGVFGDVLQAALDYRDVHKHDVATALEKSDSAISHLLSGRTKAVDEDTSARIAKILDTPEDFWSRLKVAEKMHPERPASYYLRLLGFEIETGLPAGILVDHQVDKLVERWKGTDEGEYKDDTLIIEPYAKQRMKATGYDTHIGGVWSGPPRDSIPRSLRQGEALTIGPNSTRYVHSREFFRMPADIVGRVGPTVDLITCGVSVSHGPLIAPLFRGRLTVALHNFTADELQISPDVRFIKVVFEKLSALPERREDLVGLDLLAKAQKDRSFLEEQKMKMLQEVAAIDEALASVHSQDVKA